jgi:hypothetical protein
VIVVFLGPSLPVERARQELDAVYLPPVAHGDVYRVALRKPDAIVIIDGFFQQVRSVWHKEILWAMHRGIRVYGGASMGALRAAELADFGMVGVGRIFEDFYQERLEDDDEVAIVHGSMDTGFRALSEAMVNIRSTLDRAVTCGVIDDTARGCLISIGRETFYPRRNWMTLLDAADGRVPADALQRLREWLPGHRVDQKAEDALAVLRRVRDDDGQRAQCDFHFEHTNHFEHSIRRAGVAGTSLDGVMLHSDALLEELRLRGVPHLLLAERALLRDAVQRLTKATGLLPDPADVRRAAARFRALRGLAADADFEEWLVRNDLDRARFDALMHEEAALRSQRRRVNPDSVLQQLRADDDYADLRERAEEKARRLSESGLQAARPEDVQKTADWLMDWYFERLGRPRPADPAEYARTFGFDDEAAFHRALAREYAFSRLA